MLTIFKNIHNERNDENRRFHGLMLFWSKIICLNFEVKNTRKLVFEPKRIGFPIYFPPYY